MSKKSKGYELHCTEDYDIFVLIGYNREIREEAHLLLLKSMQEVGFMPSRPIQVVPVPGGKLGIIEGQHRWFFAKRLGLPVYYVVDESCTDLYYTQRTNGPWKLVDYLFSRSLRGDKDCAAVLDFSKRHRIPHQAAADLLMNQTAGSHNAGKKITDGSFRVGDTKHAELIGRIIDACRESGVAFCCAAAFVKALSMSARVPEFDAGRFLHGVRTHPGVMQQRSRFDQYLEEIEGLYNHGRGIRIPLAFRANELSRERKLNFGESRKAKRA